MAALPGICAGVPGSPLTPPPPAPDGRGFFVCFLFHFCFASVLFLVYFLPANEAVEKERGKRGNGAGVGPPAARARQFPVRRRVCCGRNGARGACLGRGCFRGGPNASVPVSCGRCRHASDGVVAAVVEWIGDYDFISCIMIYKLVCCRVVSKGVGGVRIVFFCGLGQKKLQNEKKSVIL